MDQTEGTGRWGEEENVDLHFPNIFWDVCLTADCAALSA